jgi:hypothetical protein
VDDVDEVEDAEALEVDDADLVVDDADVEDAEVTLVDDLDEVADVEDAEVTLVDDADEVAEVEDVEADEEVDELAAEVPGDPKGSNTPMLGGDE